MKLVLSLLGDEPNCVILAEEHGICLMAFYNALELPKVKTMHKAVYNRC